MTIFKNKNSFDKSNVIFDGKKIQLYDKNKNTDSMNHIDYGLSLFKKKIFKEIKLDQFDLSTIFNELSLRGDLDSYLIDKRFYEIGSFSGIKDFELYVLENNL